MALPIAIVSLLALFPKLDAYFKTAPWMMVKVWNIAMYLVSVYTLVLAAISTPTIVNNDTALDESSNQLVASLPAWKRPHTIMWTPILLGELGAVTSTLLRSRSDPLVPLLRRSSAGFVMALALQSLWTTQQQQQVDNNYTRKNGWRWSGLVLFGAALAMYQSIKVYWIVETAEQAAEHFSDIATKLLYAVPTSWHCAWLLLVSLVWEDPGEACPGGGHHSNERRVVALPRQARPPPPPSSALTKNSKTFGPTTSSVVMAATMGAASTVLRHVMDRSSNKPSQWEPLPSRWEPQRLQLPRKAVIRREKNDIVLTGL